MKKNLVEHIKERVNQFVEETIKDLPDRERLREPLKRCLLKYDLLKYAISNAKNLDELEERINESAELLERRIGQIRNFIAKYARLKKSLINLEVGKSKPIFPASIGSKNDGITQLFNDLTNLENDISNTIAELEFFKTDLPSLIHEVEISKRYEKFKMLRKRQRRNQKLYRFLWAVIIAGFAISFVSSNALKLILLNKWLLLAIGIILTLAIAIIKEYWVGPWIRSKRLELQRKHLLLCLADFSNAEIALVLYAPERLLDELVLSYEDSPA